VRRQRSPSSRTPLSLPTYVPTYAPRQVPFIDLAAGVVALIASEAPERGPVDGASPSPACAVAFELYDPHGDGSVGRFEVAHFAEAWVVATAALEMAVLERAVSGHAMSTRWRAAAEECRINDRGSISIERFYAWFRDVLVGGAGAAALAAVAAALPEQRVGCANGDRTTEAQRRAELVDAAQLLLLPPRSASPSASARSPPPQRPANLALHRPLRNVSPVRVRGSGNALSGVPIAAGRADDLLAFNRRPVAQSSPIASRGAIGELSTSRYAMNKLHPSSIIVDRAVAYSAHEGGGGCAAVLGGTKPQRDTRSRVALEAEVAALRLRLLG
jgi:hypothetical protein